MRVAGRLFAPETTRSEPAELSLVGKGDVRLFAGGGAGDEGRAVDLVAGGVPAEVDRVPRRLLLTTGETFETEDRDGVDALLAASRHGGPSGSEGQAFIRPRLIATLVLVLMLSSVLLLAAALMRSGVPVAGDVAVTLVPRSVDREVGEHTLATLDRVAFTPSRATPAETEAARQVFGELAAAAGLGPDGTRLVFRGGGALGANAFGLPGGIIVVTDEMLARAPDADALAGVFAHELSHVDERHGMQRVLRAAGLGAATMAMFGYTDAILDDMTGIVDVAIDLSYSRAFESEADARAAEILVAAGRSPAGLTRLLRALAEAGDSPGVRWFSTHPGIADRAEALRAPPPP